ncbi:FMN-binding negative transcriptional regulator [Saccharopolyspora sp. NPDC000995]
MHLAPPIWRTLEHDPRCALSIVDVYAYIPGPSRVEGDTLTSAGVPTSHYANVQLSDEAELVDDPAAMAALLQPPGEAFPAVLAGLPRSPRTTARSTGCSRDCAVWVCTSSR